MESYVCVYDNCNESDIKIILKEETNENFRLNKKEHTLNVKITYEFILELVENLKKKIINNILICKDSEYQIYNNEVKDENVIYNQEYIVNTISKIKNNYYYLENNCLLILDNIKFTETTHFLLNLLNQTNVYPANIIIKNLDNNHLLSYVLNLEYYFNKKLTNNEYNEYNIYNVFEEYLLEDECYGEEDDKSEDDKSEDDKSEDDKSEDDDNKSEDDDNKSEDDKSEDDDNKSEDDDNKSEDDDNKSEDDKSEDDEEKNNIINLDNDFFQLLKKNSNSSSNIKLTFFNKNNELIEEKRINLNKRFVNNLVLENVNNNFENILFNKLNFSNFLKNIKFFNKYYDIYNFHNNYLYYFFSSNNNHIDVNKISYSYFDKFVDRHSNLFFNIISFIIGLSMLVMFLSNFISHEPEFYL